MKSTSNTQTYSKATVDCGLSQYVRMLRRNEGRMGKMTMEKMGVYPVSRYTMLAATVQPKPSLSTGMITTDANFLKTGLIAKDESRHASLIVGSYTPGIIDPLGSITMAKP